MHSQMLLKLICSPAPEWCRLSGSALSCRLTASSGTWQRCHSTAVSWLLLYRLIAVYNRAEAVALTKLLPSFADHVNSVDQNTHKYSYLMVVSVWTLLCCLPFRYWGWLVQNLSVAMPCHILCITCYLLSFSVQYN